MYLRWRGKEDGILPLPNQCGIPLRLTIGHEILHGVVSVTAAGLVKTKAENDVTVRSVAVQHHGAASA